MAGRYGSSSGGASTMIVTNTPAKDLAYTNCAYCSPTDLKNFLVPGSKFAYGLVADAFVYVSLAALMIKDNALWCCLNSETLPTTPFLMVNLVLMRFKDAMPKFPLETLYPLTGLAELLFTEDFALALLTLDLSLWRKGTKDEQVDTVSLANQFAEICQSR
ncbi:hypothetical protein HAX54_042871 [Datura stramonium]|uniref:Uncharacterized protein n=1 Tax=Datura stramonium TaxID=4076 RepID=A0ABS8W1W1_DATST|nr:hypothetical protein [Datura stramonium]